MAIEPYTYADLGIQTSRHTNSPILQYSLSYQRVVNQKESGRKTGIGNDRACESVDFQGAIKSSTIGYGKSKRFLRILRTTPQAKTRSLEEALIPQNRCLYLYLKISNENVDFDDENINNEDVNVNNENVNISNENENENVMNDNNEQFIPPLDIYDPSNLENLDNNLRDILIEKVAIRESNFVYPKDNLSKHFSYASYTRKLSNANDGFNDWKHLFDRLKEHENSSQHLFCMDSWDELIARLDKNKTIDKDLQNKVLTEK
ncbi:uncharacterized protein LOC111882238 [Lactuca sativa]|uniref:uncharacterized protein LOC111882238 n=1 Tax=Lactuca sativa TaxID=4236 RepID=UPI000CD969FA|nr:uncharacterized protein LOC111882238 [Lactuca sativa]